MKKQEILKLQSLCDSMKEIFKKYEDESQPFDTVDSIGAKISQIEDEIVILSERANLI